MGNPSHDMKQNTNQSFVIQKNKISFKPIRSRIKSKKKQKNKSPMVNYKFKDKF